MFKVLVGIMEEIKGKIHWFLRIMQDTGKITHIYYPYNTREAIIYIIVGISTVKRTN